MDIYSDNLKESKFSVALNDVVKNSDETDKSDFSRKSRKYIDSQIMRRLKVI